MQDDFWEDYPRPDWVKLYPARWLRSRKWLALDPAFRGAFDAICFNLMQERTYHLAVSAGAVRCDPASGTALAAYVQLADQEMYLHKRSCLH